MKNIESISSKIQEPLAAVDECIKQIKEKDKIVKIVIFIKTKDTPGFYKIRNELKECVREKNKILAPVSVLSQPPANGETLSLEVWKFKGAHIEYKEIDEVKYSVILKNNDKEILSEAITPEETVDMENACREVFAKESKLLAYEGMDFGNVVRQWNYIQDITKIINNRQNYQVFNAIRSLYYNKANFENGYPAATGIGMEYGLVNIELIANSKKNDIYPIENNRQVPAYQYSEKVLINGRQSPKFSRGKLVLNELYISGTAAIVNQEVTNTDSVENQTKETLENLRIVQYNAEKMKSEIKYLRVYLKNYKYYEPVKELICKTFPKAEFMFVKADVCRDNLLMEIEGYAL